MIIPAGQGCCGALSWHTGEGELAKRFARELIRSIPTDVDRLVITAAGCGSAIHEYPLLLKGTDMEAKAIALAAKSVDISVYLAELELLPIPPLKRPMRVAYHDACHLAHAQGVRRQPREILRLVPGLEIAELADPDTCCGSAGTYNIEQPEIASQLGERKVQNILATGASAVVTGNIGCLVQIEKHLPVQQEKVPVLHTVQILDRAYRQILNP